MRKVLIVLLAMVFILNTFPVFAQSNYATSKDKEGAHRACLLKGYKTIIGKAFIAIPEHDCYHEFSVRSKPKYEGTLAFGSASELDEPSIVRRFGVVKPENFTVTGLLRSGASTSCDFKIKFASGKEAYISVGELSNFYVIVSMEDLKQDQLDRWQRKDHPANLIGKIEAECKGRIEEWKEWEQKQRDDLEECAKRDPSIRNWSGYKSWIK